MAGVAPTPKAFAVWFKDLERWSVGSFIALGWRWPRSTIHRLSDALLRKVEDVDRKQTPINTIRLVTLHFDGEIELRRRTGNSPIKGRLFWAEPGDMVYSKIDVRNGAIGIIPDGFNRICVTSEYPVYAVDSAVADAKYIKLVFRTSTFRRKINSMISGASGRKRVQPAELEALEVPLPPLPVQRAIVGAWEKAQKEVADTRQQINESDGRIEAHFLAELGLSKPVRTAPPKVFAVWWKDLERWSVMFNQLASLSVVITTGKYPVTTLGNLGNVSYGIQKSPANRPGQNARPYLRVANVQRGELDLREIKYINVQDSDMPTYRLQPGDLLVCEGNSADLVGRPAIWSGEIPDCVHQNHVLKVRLDQVKVMPEYVLEYMHTAAARNYFRSRAKFTTNLASINSNDLRELPLHIPPLDRQKHMVELVTAERTKIANLKADAEAKAQKSQADVEAIILGDKPVSGK